MTKQECVEVIDIALKYLGWKGGTVHQIADGVVQKDRCCRTTTVHVYIRDMLIELGVMK